MSAVGDGRVQALFRLWREGDLSARDQLFELLYPELRQAAAGLMRYEKGLSFSSGDLVHDTVMRLIRLHSLEVADKAHFLALASHMMRNVLIDHVRARRRDKRKHIKVELTSRIEGAKSVDFDMIEDALRKLAVVDGGHAQIVEMRYYGNMSIGDVAVVLGCSEMTVKRRWRAARAWLIDQMGFEGGGGAAVTAVV
jgi:RNA polymerase sigma factor (TIGR02999 family)